MSETTGYGRKKDFLYFSRRTDETIHAYYMIGIFLTIFWFCVLLIYLIIIVTTTRENLLKKSNFYIANLAIGTIICIPILYYRLKTIYFIRKLLKISDEDEKQGFSYEELISKLKKFKKIAIVASALYPLPIASLVFDIWNGRSGNCNYKKLLDKKNEERVLYEGYKFFTENRDEIVKDGGLLASSLKKSGCSGVVFLLASLTLLLILVSGVVNRFVSKPDYQNLGFIPLIFFYFVFLIFHFHNVFKAFYLLKKLSSIDEEDINEESIRKIIENCKKAKDDVITDFLSGPNGISYFGFFMGSPLLTYRCYFKELEFFKKTKKE